MENQGWVYKKESVNQTMGKWKYHDYFTRDVIV